MRIASKKPNTLRLHDNLSNSVVEIYYRTPNPKENATYMNGFSKRVRNKVVTTTGENRQKWGAKILVGFRDGDFGYENDAGDVVPVSSNRGSEHFREDWKEWFCTNFPDLVDTLAIHAFENTSDTDDTEDLPDGKDTNPS